MNTSWFSRHCILFLAWLLHDINATATTSTYAGLVSAIRRHWQIIGSSKQKKTRSNCIDNFWVHGCVKKAVATSTSTTTMLGRTRRTTRNCVGGSSSCSSCQNTIPDGRWCNHHHPNDGDDDWDCPPLEKDMIVEQEMFVSRCRGGSVSRSSSSSSNSSNPKADASLWPPWPFNLLFQTSGDFDKDGSSPSSQSFLHQNNAPDHIHRDDKKYISQPSKRPILPNMQLFLSYLRLKAKGGFEQMQQVGSALSFHLPPAAPPLVLLAILPTHWVVDKMQQQQQQQQLPRGGSAVTTALASTCTTKSSKFSYFPNVLAKRLALASLSVAVLSWADYEVRYKKKLTPLPLLPVYRNVRKAILPPFLPEAIPVEEVDVTEDPMGPLSQSQHASNNHNDNHNNTAAMDDNALHWESSLKTSMVKMYQRATSKPQRLQLVMQSWRKMNRIRQKEEMEIKRRQIMEELIIWRELKKQRERMYAKNSKGRGTTFQKDKTEKDGTSSIPIGESSPPLGYALVTGASRGIGRALAVELARWEIPLILIARDVEKLCNVANEIEAAYGVNCCVIPADLSNPQVAQQIYKATEDAGLRVDILINNAGVCSYGDLTDSSQEAIAQMMNVNVCAVTHLSHLYGQNMKRQGRGRILFVSSVIGATPGGPGVATYAATKSYEKSLAQSMGRELEKYGVGVTCIMPGAVRGTDFAVKSNCADSACWKFPCYSMSTPNVAARGVRALLSGDSEIIPGWHNRLFLKVFSPLLPPRLTTSIVGFSFSPFQFGMPTFAWGSKEQQPMNKEEEESYQQQIIDNFNVPPKIIKLADLDTSHDKNTSPPIQMESPSSFTQNMDPSGSRVDNEEEHLTKTADESELGSAI